MTAVDLLTTCRAAGIVLVPDGNMLDVDAPRGALTPSLRDALLRHKPELLAVLTRLVGMRLHTWPVPMARPDAKGGPGCCFRCGAALDHPQGYGRCAPCDFAANLYYAERAQALDDEAGQ